MRAWLAGLALVMAGCAAPPEARVANMQASWAARMAMWRADCRMDPIERVERCTLRGPADERTGGFVRLAVSPDGAIRMRGIDTYPRVYRARSEPSGHRIEGLCQMADEACLAPPGTFGVWQADLLAGGGVTVQLNGRPDAPTVHGGGLREALAEVERRDPRWTAPPPAAAPARRRP